MLIKGKDVLITYQELVEVFSVSSDTVKRGIQRNKQDSKCWKFFVDKTDKRKRSIFYSTIPESTVIKYNLPTLEQLKERIRCEQAAQHREQKLDVKEQKVDDVHAVLSKYIDKHSYKFYSQYKKEYPGDSLQATQKANEHALLIKCFELKDSKTCKLSELHKAYIKFPFASIKNYEAFSRKLSSIKGEGFTGVVHGRQGKKLPTKLNPFIVANIRAYLSDSRILPYAMIHEMVNAVINKHNQDNGTDWKNISLSSVRYYALCPENRNEFELNRFGAKAYSNNVKPYIPRLTALYAGDLYQMDGSPIQIFCMDEKGEKPIRLNLFIVRDDYSGKIVGFDMARSEDRYNLLSAMNMAFKLHGHAPAEIVHDNASGTKTAEFTAIKTELENMGVILRPARVGNGQDKGETERWFETFQSQYQRLIDGYIGEGITSKRKNGRIDIDFINKVRKEKGFYGYNEVMQIITELIAIYNNSKNANGIIPNVAYRECKKPNVRDLRPEEIAMMFNYSKEIKVHRSMIVTEIRGQKYHYQIFENKHKVQLNGTTVKMYYDENDLSTVFVFDKKGRFVCECRQYVKPHQAQVNQTDDDVMQIIKQSANHNSLKPYLEQRNLQVRQEGEAFAGQPLALIDVLDFKKQNLNDGESQVLMDTYYKIKGITPVDYKAVISDNEFTREDKSDLKKLNENLYTVKKPSLKPIATIPLNEIQS